MTSSISRAVVICAALLTCGSAAAQPAPAQPAQPGQATPTALAAQPAQRTFPSAKAAADALVTAAANYDVSALKEILGAEGFELIAAETPARDKSQSEAWAAKAREKLRLVPDPKHPKSITLNVGKDDWPMPIPVVNEGGKWRFDAAAGRQEILYRRIGQNELDAIEVCRGFVEAQREYAAVKRNGARVHQYAQRIISTPGKQDGLAWRNADGTWDGPVGEAIARVIAEGYRDKYPPYHGYHFKILKGQGPSARLGALDFIVQGAMIGGFALVAAPAGYQITGVQTFIVSHDGVVFEKDLGPQTPEQFRAMELFEPDKSWTPIKAR